MKHIRLAFALVVALTGCGGGNGSAIPTSSSGNVPNPNGATSAKPSTLLWFNSCGRSCNTTTAIQAFNPVTGSMVANFSFPIVTLGQPYIATSPNQQHVYGTVTKGGDNAIADINPQTFAENVFPVAPASGAFTGLAVSPDGTRLYASTANANGGTLYVIDTRGCTTIAKVKLGISELTPSPDGRTLFGVSGGALIAVDTKTLVATTGPALIGPLLGASATRLYTVEVDEVFPLDAEVTVHTYNAVSPYQHVGTIPLGRVGNVFDFYGNQIMASAFDSTASRLYVGFLTGTFPLSGQPCCGNLTPQIEVVDTTANQLTTTVRLPSGDEQIGPYYLLAADPVTHVLYSSASSVCAIQPSTYAQACVPAPPVYGIITGPALTTSN